MRRVPSRRRVLFSALGILLGLTNNACLPNIAGLFDGQVLLRDDVEARDADGIFPGLRVSRDLLADPADPRQGLVELGAPASVEPPRASARGTDAPSAVPPTRAPDTPSKPRVQAKLSVEAEYTVGVGGNDARSVISGRYVDYDGIVLDGPQVLRSSFDLHLASVGARAGGQLFGLISLEGLGGLSLTALDLELRGSRGRARDTGVSMGVHVGGRATLTPHPVVDFYGEGKLHLLGGLQESRRTVVLATAEAGGNLHLTSGISLFGGYRWWRYFEDIHSASDIDDIVLEGPTMGLLLRF